MENVSFAPVEDLRRYITDELFKAADLSPDGRARGLLDFLVRIPTGRFAKIASDFDRAVSGHGLQKSAQGLLPRFARSVRAGGENYIPTKGPLVIASNHPGAIDSLVLASVIPRPDLKIIVSGVPILQELVACRPHLIFSTLDTHQRMSALRQSLRHLQAGGALLIFASAVVDPDPAIMPGAEESLSKWFRSLEYLLKKVPQSKLVISIVSGVLASNAMRNPLVRLRTGRMERQRLAEFFQIMGQLIVPRLYHLHPAVSFSPPMTRASLQAIAGSEKIHTGIQIQARRHLQDHVATYVNPHLQGPITPR
jgi:hypothetical protein